MQYFIKLSIGATIIFLIFILCFRFSDNVQAEKYKAGSGLVGTGAGRRVSVDDVMYYVAVGGAVVGPAVDWGNAAPNFAAYKAALDAEDWYKLNRAFVPVFAYNESKKILIPYNITGKVARKPLTYPEGAIVMASSRDAVVRASRDVNDRIDNLEERVRKLENTVSKITSKCCPEAKQ